MSNKFVIALLLVVVYLVTVQGQNITYNADSGEVGVSHEDCYNYCTNDSKLPAWLINWLCGWLCHMFNHVRIF